MEILIDVYKNIYVDGIKLLKMMKTNSENLYILKYDKINLIFFPCFNMFFQTHNVMYPPAVSITFPK